MLIAQSTFPGSFNTNSLNNGNGNGGGKHNPAPEPAVYGMTFVALCIVMLLWRRMWRR